MWVGTSSRPAPQWALRGVPMALPQSDCWRGARWMSAPPLQVATRPSLRLGLPSLLPREPHVTAPPALRIHSAKPLGTQASRRSAPSAWRASAKPLSKLSGRPTRPHHFLLSRLGLRRARWAHHRPVDRAAHLACDAEGTGRDCRKRLVPSWDRSAVIPPTQLPTSGGLQPERLTGWSPPSSRVRATVCGWFGSSSQRCHRSSSSRERMGVWSGPTI